MQSHAWRHMWGRHELKHSVTCAQSLTPRIIHGHLNLKHACQHITPLVPDSLTAFTRLSALGMCSMSTNGWVKNSAKVIRASGFLSSSRNRRSLQSLDTLAPGGSWCTKHDLIMLHSIRTIRGKRTADCCQGLSALPPLLFIKGWP